MAEQRAAFMRFRSGKEANTEKGIIVSQIRRRLSSTIMKAQVDCLLSKLHLVGPGGRINAKHREWSIKVEERMSRERHAQWLRKFDGIKSLRKGFIKVD